jgi:hypothetical protein
VQNELHLFQWYWGHNSGSHGHEDFMPYTWDIFPALDFNYRKLTYELWPLHSAQLFKTCMCLYVGIHLIVFLCITMCIWFCFVPVGLYAHVLKCTSFLADHDHGYGTAGRRDRAELSKEQPPASSQRRQVTGNSALLPVYSYAGYITPSNSQIHQQRSCPKISVPTLLHFGNFLGESRRHP